MKKYFRLIIFLVFPAAAIPYSRGQDPNYTQFFSTPIYFNPAYTGASTGIRTRFSFRDQWPNLPADFKAYYFSADLGDRNLPGSGGLGLMVNSDNEGIGFMHNLSFALTIAARIPISSFMISQIGIKAAVVQKTVNWEDFVFSDQLSEKYGNLYPSTFIPPDVDKRVFPDFGVGGLLQFSNSGGNITGTAGFAVDHLFTPDESFLANGKSPLPRKYVAHLDAVITPGGGSYSNMSYSGSDPLKINPGIYYQNQSSLSSLQVGFNLLKYNIYLGAWYKNTLNPHPNSVMALLAGYRFMFAQDMSIKFMYSYDIQISGSLQGTGGAHEISLILEFDKVSLFGGRGGGMSASPGRSIRGSAPLESPSFY